MRIINRPLACLLGITAFIGVCTCIIQGESRGVSSYGADAIRIEDDTKEIVSLPDVAKRIVSISSADSELLIALGVNPVGVVNSKELPVDVQQKINQYPSMNSAVSPSIEKIIMADPNLVIGIAMPFQTALRKAFNENHIPSFYHLSANYDGINQHILHVGAMTGHTIDAQTLVKKYDDTLYEILQRHNNENKPRETADEETLDGYIPLNLETMAILDCDKVILLNHGSTGEEDIQAFKKAFKTPAWQNVPAIKNEHIAVLPGSLFSTVPTARMDQVLLYAEKVLYE